MMCPEMAGEANPGAESSPTSRTEVGGGSVGGAGCSGLSHLTFLFCGLGSAFLGRVGTSTDETTPVWAVGSEGFPGFSADIEVLEGDFQAVLEALPLPTNRALAMAEFPIEQLFGDAGVRHASNVACPAEL